MGKPSPSQWDAGPKADRGDGEYGRGSSDDGQFSTNRAVSVASIGDPNAN
jgi:hypothetical protein